jgi:hypothetical protein
MSTQATLHCTASPTANKSEPMKLRPVDVQNGIPPAQARRPQGKPHNETWL